MTVQAHYWAGESGYAMGDYDGALAKYDDVRNTGGAYATALFEQAGYSMGYAFFKKKQYGEAAIAFRRAIDNTDLPKAQRNDAMMHGRLLLCDQGQRHRDHVVRQGDQQRGDRPRLCPVSERRVPRAEKKYDQKIATLKQLLRDKPNSQYAADAKFQLGKPTSVWRRTLRHWSSTSRW